MRPLSNGRKIGAGLEKPNVLTSQPLSQRRHSAIGIAAAAMNDHEVTRRDEIIAVCALPALPPRCRAAFRMAFRVGRDAGRVCGQLGCSAATTKRGRDAVRRAATREDGGRKAACWCATAVRLRCCGISTAPRPRVVVGAGRHGRPPQADRRAHARDARSHVGRRQVHRCNGGTGSEEAHTTFGSHGARRQDKRWVHPQRRAARGCCCGCGATRRWQLDYRHAHTQRRPDPEWVGRGANEHREV
jgi:hypothetical protein